MNIFSINIQRNRLLHYNKNTPAYASIAGSIFIITINDFDIITLYSDQFEKKKRNSEFLASIC